MYRSPPVATPPPPAPARALQHASYPPAPRGRAGPRSYRAAARGRRGVAQTRSSGGCFICGDHGPRLNQCPCNMHAPEGTPPAPPQGSPAQQQTPQQQPQVHMVPGDAPQGPHGHFPDWSPTDPEEGDLAEPVLAITVKGMETLMVVGTGAQFFCLSSVPKSFLSSQYVSVLGFTGREQKLQLTRPLCTILGNQMFYHQFLYSPNCPVGLLGRDILRAVGVTLCLSPQGLMVHLPGEIELHCEHLTSCYPLKQMVLLKPPASSQAPMADIYWAALATDSVPAMSVCSLYSLWRPWISSR